MTDLTQIKTPFGLLDKDTQQALRDWPHGWQVFASSGEWVDVVDPPLPTAHTFRAKPEPKRVEGYVSVYRDGFGPVWDNLILARHSVPPRPRDRLTTFRISYNPDGTDPQIERVEGD